MTADLANTRLWRLLNLLADGEFHSGDYLAGQLGISRASVFDALAGAADFGIALQRIRGRGYRLARRWQRLERQEISRWLGNDAQRFEIEILPQASSSNTLLLQRAGMGDIDRSPRSCRVLVVELQTAGRGRMGRTWYSGLGNSLTFSLLRRFDRGLNDLSGLSLAAGVGIVRALNKLGAPGVQLKWPNDILTAQGKLGGVLIEAQGDVLGPSTVVIGVGLNCTLTEDLECRIDQSACALEDVCEDMPERNQLLAILLQELANVLQQFEQRGFSSMREEWQRYHVHQDRPVRLKMPDDTAVNGVARGVSDQGELCLETAQGMRNFSSGEVRVRDEGSEHPGAGATASHPLPQSRLPARVSRVRR
jgi:BirA family transcriptional regulator, biotin operon repressor / biotin---[acetyl-CoA-carboxylase] ligase